MLRQVLLSLFRLLGFTDKATPNLAAMLWLTLPWLLGVNAWPASIPLIISGIFFMLSAHLVFTAWCNSQNSFVLPSLLYLWCLLSYEHFYLQYIFIIGFGFIARVHQKNGWRQIIFPFILFSLAQTAALYWNRYAAQAVNTVKPAFPDWQFIFNQNLANFYQNVVVTSSIELIKPITFLLLAIIFITIVQIFRQLAKSKFKVFSLRHLLIIFCPALGYITAVFVYSIVGYNFLGKGMISRTTTAVSFWLVVAFSLAFSLIFSSIVAPVFKRVYLGLVIALIILFSFSTVVRTMDWANSWRTQQLIIDQLPLDKLLATDKNSTIVYITPNTINEVNVFLGVLDLTNALLLRYPQLDDGRIFIPHIPQNYPSYYNFGQTKISFNYNIWDGQQVTYNQVPYAHSSEVYLWNFFTGEFSRQNHPFIIKDGEIKLLNEV